MSVKKPGFGPIVCPLLDRDAFQISAHLDDPFGHGGGLIVTMTAYDLEDICT